MLNVKTVLFQTIHFSMNTQFSSIWAIDRTLSDATTPGQSVAYSYAYRNIFNTIRTSRHSSLEKYTSHFIERFVCERELETEQNCNMLTPNSSGYHSLSFPFSWAAQPGAWGPSLCWDMVLIPASSLQLNWTSCRQGYIIIWHPPISCERHNFAPNSTPRQSRLPLISWYLRPDAPVIYTGAFLLLIAWPGSICNKSKNIYIYIYIYICFAKYI